MGPIAVILLLVGMAVPIAIILATVIFDGGLIVWILYKHLKTKWRN